MKISVTGTGYVGLSLAVLLAKKNEVIALDTNREKIDLINKKISPIKDNDISLFLENEDLNLIATTTKEIAYQNAEIIIIATPTNYDTNTNYFDTSSVEAVIYDISTINKSAIIIIKSTVPVGFTERMQHQFPNQEIIFSPEFLREGKALYDNLYPSRIIVGGEPEKALLFANVLKESAIKKDINILVTKSTEAEAIKLFANTYLAMRVSYFNELDSYAETHSLDTKKIIEGVCLDPRIGTNYNNPSFGYGGYCLPKDTKQLLANYQDVPQSLIKAIVESNEIRKEFISNSIIKKKPHCVGIYRLVMKSDSDNFRSSSIQCVIENLKKAKIDMIIYEPNIRDDYFSDIPIENNFNEFTKKSSLIVANRITDQLSNILDKVYTRDIFRVDI